MFYKNELERIKTNTKKYMPEILDVYITYAFTKDCIETSKNIFENLPVPVRERIRKSIQSKD